MRARYRQLDSPVDALSAVDSFDSTDPAVLDEPSAAPGEFSAAPGEFTAAPDAARALPPMVRPPGMHDVARVAGVSHQTVSRVVNNNPTVRAETRARVEAAILALGFRPNSAARTLVTRRSGNIGVLTSRTTLFGPTSVLLQLEAAAREAGFFVSLVSLVDSTAEHTRAAVEHLLNQGVEGLVLVAASQDMVDAAYAVSGRLPVVLNGAVRAPPPGVSVASVDQLAGGRIATRHLIDLGHTSIAHVAGPADSLDGMARLAGWRHELFEAFGTDSTDSADSADSTHSADSARSPLVHGDWSAESGYRAGQALARGELPSAVFAANDEMALGLLLAFAEAGVRVPGDVSVVGYDDVAGSAFYSPPLTTVRQDFGALGNACVALLASAITGGAVEQAVWLPPSLVARASSGPPRST